jgi:hypothetical protein
MAGGAALRVRGCQTEWDTANTCPAALFDWSKSSMLARAEVIFCADAIPFRIDNIKFKRNQYLEKKGKQGSGRLQHKGWCSTKNRESRRG